MLLVNVDLGDVVKVLVFSDSTDALSVMPRLLGFGAALSFEYGADPGALRQTKPLLNMRRVIAEQRSRLDNAAHNLAERRKENAKGSVLRGALSELSFENAALAALTAP